MRPHVTCNRRATHKAGFSLIELSIVLVILGLLVGGVLGGRALIRAAQLNSVTAEFQQYQVAVNAFMLKYDGVPGDITDADAYFGARASCPTVPTGYDKGVCNGDGNGRILDKNPVNPCTSTAFSAPMREGFQFWAQLSRSGLIAGDYSGGREGTGTIYWETNVNAPGAKIARDLVWVPVHTWCTPRFWTGDWQSGRQSLMLGSPSVYAPSPSAALPPQDMWSLDKKVDDGMPGTGSFQVMHYPSGVQRCALGDPEDYATATYNLEGDSIACAPILLFDAL